MKPIRRQKPVRGGRVPRSAGFLRELDAAINREARRFNVSRSFVIAVATAHTLCVEIDDYADEPASTRVRRFQLLKRRTG